MTTTMTAPAHPVCRCPLARLMRWDYIPAARPCPQRDGAITAHCGDCGGCRYCPR